MNSRFYVLTNGKIEHGGPEGVDMIGRTDIKCMVCSDLTTVDENVQISM